MKNLPEHNQLDRSDIAAVVLAAGLSKRMGSPKMVLPWGHTTVIGQVVETVLAAGVKDVFIVTGGARAEVENVIKTMPVATVYNPLYQNGEMLYSIKIGLESLPSAVNAALIVLGDQPQIEIQVVRSLLDLYKSSGGNLLIPSHAMRRGHPWLVSRQLWPQIISLSPPHTMRDFLEANKSEIHYMEVSTPSVLMDLDTPDDYKRSQKHSS